MLELIKKMCPIGSREQNVELQYHEVERPDLGTNSLVFRLIVWGRDEGSNHQYVRDVKEEVVRFPDIYSDYLVQFMTALKNTIERIMLSYDRMESVMPSDLLHCRLWSALLLKQAKTVENFEAALSVKSRLGRYLPDVQKTQMQTQAV